VPGQDRVTLETTPDCLEITPDCLSWSDPINRADRRLIGLDNDDGLTKPAMSRLSEWVRRFVRHRRTVVAHRGRQLLARLLVGHRTGAFFTSPEFTLAHRQALASRLRATTAVQVDGIQIHASPADWAVGGGIVRDGAYESAVTEVVGSHLRPGGTFVDVGANIGWFTLFAARRVGGRGHVLAVEPNPANCELIRRSAANNGFNQVRLIPAAASNRAGAVALETDASNGRIIPVDAATTVVPCSYVVPARTIDDMVDEAGLDNVDVIKIDVEGAEPLVVQGAAKTIARWRPVLVCELFPLALQTTGASSAPSFLAQLRDLGYRLSVIGGPPDESDSDILRRLENNPDVDHVDLLAEPVARSS
jgi:FkbM family methyltransferase